MYAFLFTDLFASKEIIYILGNHDRDTCYKKLPEQRQITVDKTAILNYLILKFMNTLAWSEQVYEQLGNNIYDPTVQSFYRLLLKTWVTLLSSSISPTVIAGI